MSAAHTPGPWEAKHNRNVTVEGPCRPVCNSEGYPTAFVPAWDDAAEEAEANARLIAAAPDLLEALEEAIATSDRLCAERGWVRAEEAEETLTKMRAALAKATGAQ